MASDFSDQQLSYRALERLLTVLAAAGKGDFSQRMKADGNGIMEREVSDAVNAVIETNARVTADMLRLSSATVRGDLKARSQLSSPPGGWGTQVRAMEAVVDSYSRHVAEVRRVTKALLAGELDCRVPVAADTVHCSGELQQVGEELNAVMAALAQLTTELREVCDLVAHEGRLSARCHASLANGGWGQIVIGFNQMMSALSDQIQGMSVTAQTLSTGDFSARTWVNAQGDLQQLKLGLNGTAESMAAMSAELRRVAQEVAGDGRLTAEMRMADPRGEWLGSQDAVNRMLGKIGSALKQVDDITDRMLRYELAAEPDIQLPGELGGPVQRLRTLAEVEVQTHKALEVMLQGRFSELKADTNERGSMLFMLGTRLKHEWFSAARAGIIEARHTQPELVGFARAVLTHLTNTVNASLSAYYAVAGESVVRAATLGCEESPDQPRAMRAGEGLIGKVALEGKPLLLDKLEKTGVRIRSGLLEVTPQAALIFPVRRGEQVVAVIELVFMNDGATTALELLDHLNTDLGAQASFEQHKTSVDTRELQEELAIATARLEQRDSQLRELQAETRLLRDQLASAKPAA